ncbi:MAG: flagellar hook protein [Desulfovibrio sp.]|nr:flagellar hook protein [Desulfovibrio sp.]
MSLRVTQNVMYRTMMGQMQKSLSAYMESNEQGSTQKKINRPSDDPAGMYRVLMTRNDISATTQYQSNVDMAKGLLTLADNVLGTQVSTVLTELKSLAEQASTGSYTAENRKQMGFEARQLFSQFINLANTEFEGKSIFAGHIYDSKAFEEGLGLCSWDENWNAAIESGEYLVEGACDTSLVIQFTQDGVLSDLPSYRWSDDGGETWHDGTITTDNVQLALGRNTSVAGARLDLGNGVQVTMKADLAVQAADVDAGPGADNGTLVYVRPQALYQGDDSDTLEVTVLGDSGVTASAAGTFGSNMLVRLDSDADLTAADATVSYSYSTDSGSSWVPATASTTGNSTLHLLVPGGYVDVEGESVAEGAQVLVRSHRGEFNLEVMKGSYISLNNVGKDIFGGEYDGKPELPAEEDLFGMVGDFVAYLENNNQEGCQRTLARIDSVQQHILTECARIGGMENRIETISDVLSFQKVDQQERLSYTEDIDLTELLTKLTQQQLTYQTVLQSSSKIMQMNLANYL